MRWDCGKGLKQFVKEKDMPTTDALIYLNQRRQADTALKG